LAGETAQAARLLQAIDASPCSGIGIRDAARACVEWRAFAFEPIGRRVIESAAHATGALGLLAVSAAG
jgi:hypothetical protein